MKDDTKNRILTCARGLFKERGYNAVSMRNIAEALDISVGNLTYHFKKKEELIEALIFESIQSYEDASGKIQDIDDLNAYFHHLLSVQNRLSFYFDSYHQLSQTSSVLQTCQTRMTGNLKKTLSLSFDALLKSALIRPEEYKGQYQDIIKVITALLLFRLPGEERRLRKDDEEKTLRTLWFFLKPYLTEEGRLRLSRLP